MPISLIDWCSPSVVVGKKKCLGCWCMLINSIGSSLGHVLLSSLVEVVESLICSLVVSGWWWLSSYSGQETKLSSLLIDWRF